VLSRKTRYCESLLKHTGEVKAIEHAGLPKPWQENFIHLGRGEATELYREVDIAVMGLPWRCYISLQFNIHLAQPIV
jgi:hypothetical protein